MSDQPAKSECESKTGSESLTVVSPTERGSAKVHEIIMNWLVSDPVAAVVNAADRAAQIGSIRMGDPAA